MTSAFHEPENGTVLSGWVERLTLQMKDHQDQLLHLVPWTDLLPVPDNFARLAMLDPRYRLLPVIADDEGCLYKTAFDEYDRQEHSAAEKEWLRRMHTAI